jgi:2OG-Fe(II) oxygenase superfamily
MQDSSPDYSKVRLDRLGDDLYAALSNVKASGSFMTSKSFSNCISPGLEVPGIGTIGLPLAPRDAEAIIKCCHASPYGKGGETLVNDSVRKSWELDADQFCLHNPAWKEQIESLVINVVSGLGLLANPQEVKAELYKLLLYGEEAFFLPHQDTEKADGMFGTLVVCLPSKHEGGDVIASHKGEHLKFSTAKTSEFGFSYAAWYSDVRHEVKPVTSGYRLALTYNLIHRPSAALSEGRNDISTRLLSLLEPWAALSSELCPPSSDDYKDIPDWLSWASDEECPSWLFYELDHGYSDAELSFARLKGLDQVRVAELRKACEKIGLHIYLANIEKSEMGSVEDYYLESESDYCYRERDCMHNIDEVYETSFSLSYVIDPAGHVVATEVDVDASMFEKRDLFGSEPDEEDFGGYTGNEGADATHIYRETVCYIYLHDCSCDSQVSPGMRHPRHCSSIREPSLDSVGSLPVVKYPGSQLN